MSERKAKYSDAFTPDELADEEQNLLEYFRHELKYGEATVTVRRGLPVFIRVAQKDVKLD